MRQTGKNSRTGRKGRGGGSPKISSAKRRQLQPEVSPSKTFDTHQQKDERLRLLVQQAPAIFWTTDEDLRITSSLGGGLKALGLKPGQVIGMTLYEYFDHRDPEFLPIAAHLRALAGESVTFNFSYQDRHFQSHVEPLRDSDDMIRGVTGIAFDMTDRVSLELASRESEERYRAFVQHSSEGIWRFELDSPLFTELSEDDQVDFFYEHAYLAECNDVIARMYGYASAEQITGARLTEFLPRMNLTNVLMLRDFIRQDYRLVDRESVDSDRNGNVRYSLDNFVGFVQDGYLYRCWGVRRDITERKQAEALQSALYRVAEKASSAEDMQEFYRAIHGIVGELMSVKNLYIALYDQANRNLSFPYWVDEIDPQPQTTGLGRGATEYILRTGQPLLASPQKIRDLVEQGEMEDLGAPSLDYLGVPLKTGERTFGALVIQSYSESLRYGEREKEVLTFVSQHIASAIERKRAEETIRHQAYHDSLTMLPNRMLFGDRFNQALAQANRNKQMLAMLFLDLDRFKTINDTLGHAVGDRLLKSVAERLRTCTRDGDTIARLGGDEFMILISGARNIEDVAKVAEKILHVVRPSFHIEGQDLHITTSIGISLYPYDGSDAETLVKNADIALYRAKEHGRNNYQMYTPSMNARAMEQLALENRLRRALERQEFILHYQPIVDISNRNLSGMEALVRWRSPEGELVSPLDFIPLAEDTGLIVPLGEWVLQSACVQNRSWQNQGYRPHRVSVNLSFRQFQQKDLIQTIGGILRDTKMDSNMLELELTESILMKDPEMAIETMRELGSMGIRISIDDFGVGYSSLSYLRRFPIHTLKIDRSFVRDSISDPDDAAIVTAIISMAHSLKLKVVGEGVETEGQLRFLQSQGCDCIQGHYFSEPLPPSDFLKVLINQNSLAQPQ
jgi:diguanylate cyclase (GGDEF)-like protein/PAS domain S-box-containing protein